MADAQQINILIQIAIYLILLYFAFKFRDWLVLSIAGFMVAATLLTEVSIKPPYYTVLINPLSALLCYALIKQMRINHNFKELKRIVHEMYQTTEVK